MTDIIEIDGSQGEGGGQILRTSLALSAITQKPVQITQIRAGRSKPGLLNQHLCGVRALAEICGAEVRGDFLGSTALYFAPGPIRGGGRTFDVGTAGSVHLVLQTVMWPLLYADEPSRLKIDGGTHNKASPPYPYVQQAFVPLCERMSVGFGLELVRPGFYPAGGGRIIAEIRPGRPSPLTLLERGPVKQIRIAAVVSELPELIAKREITVICKALNLPLGAGRVEVARAKGPGNAVFVEVTCEHATEVFTGFGEKGVRAEQVAEGVVAEVRQWLDADVPVGEHTADQLLVPLALAGGGEFRTTAPSSHTLTNADVIARFLETRVEIAQEGASHRILVRSAGLDRHPGGS